MGIGFRDGLAHRIGGSDTGDQPFFQPHPYFLHTRTVDQFGDFRKIFVTVVNHRFSAQPSGKPVGCQGVQVVGEEQVEAMRDQEEEEPDIEFCIKEGSFPEEKAHATAVVRNFRQGCRCRELPANEQHPESHPGQGTAHPVHPLVPRQVIGHRNNDLFQNDKFPLM